MEIDEFINMVDNNLNTNENFVYYEIELIDNKVTSKIKDDDFKPAKRTSIDIDDDNYIEKLITSIKENLTKDREYMVLYGMSESGYVGPFLDFLIDGCSESSKIHIVSDRSYDHELMKKTFYDFRYGPNEETSSKTR